MDTHSYQQVEYSSVQTDLLVLHGGKPFEHYKESITVLSAIAAATLSKALL